MLFNNFSRQLSTTKIMRRDLLRLSSKKTSSIKNFLLPIPKNFFVAIAENLRASKYSIFLFNSSTYIDILMPRNYTSLYFEKETNSLCYNSLYSNNFCKIYLLTLVYIYFSFSKIFFKKIRFKGKGYYIYKNMRNTIAPQFGYSHRVYIYSWFTAIKFTSKSSLIFFGLQDYEITKASQSLQQSRKLNIFTGRGVRFARQSVYSKPGKVSSYR